MLSGDQTEREDIMFDVAKLQGLVYGIYDRLDRINAFIDAIAIM